MAQPVFIERLVVEEGFLDGLDLSFAPGLNVIIGPRGVGKTSVIQLLRFCLGAPAFTSAFEGDADKHAREILGDDGRVSVGVVVDGEGWVVSRRKFDEHPEGPVGSFLPPIVLAQTEVEEIALDPEGRLRLIDGFRTGSRQLVAQERAVVSTIHSLTLELADLERDLARHEGEQAELESQRAELRAAEAQLSVAEEVKSAASDDLNRLDTLGRQAAATQAGIAVFNRAHAALEEWRRSIAVAERGTPTLERWADQSNDGLAAIRVAARSVADALKGAGSQLDETLATLSGITAAERVRVSSWTDEARDLRKRVEELHEGTGAATHRLAVLRERVARLTSLSELALEQRSRLLKVREARGGALQELDGLRAARYADRRRVVSELNHDLGPRIDVEVHQSGLWTAYAETIAATIRGSGLHYTEVAPQIASRLSPRDLAAIVESDDAARLAAAVNIPGDRARRIIDRIRDAGLGDVLTARIDDAIALKLLDGSDYKQTEKLSTGQRCTTILPIILRHEERPVILDQPEDHLDGAFIVETLVKAVVRRRAGSQLIITTHNPNIPVLGDATRVTLLGSNGHRGFEVHSGGLDDADIVTAITSVMEGGKAAFETRAKFYGA